MVCPAGFEPAVLAAFETDAVTDYATGTKRNPRSDDGSITDGSVRSVVAPRNWHARSDSNRQYAA